ncbi:MAG: LCP family protein [Bacilli bacterium]
MRVGPWNSLVAALVALAVIGAWRASLAIGAGVGSTPRELNAAFRGTSEVRTGGTGLSTVVAETAAGAGVAKASPAPHADELWMRGALQDLAVQYPDRDPETWLLVGSDSRKGEAARADSLMLVRLNMRKKTALLCSIPRDSRLYVRNHGCTKVNHALAYGDLSLLRTTVQTAFGIRVDHVVALDFEGFIALVDALGGVVVELKRAIDYDDATDGTHIHLLAGRQRLDGKAALGFVRFRHDVLADTGRMERQQQFLRAVATTHPPLYRWWRVGNAAMRLPAHIHSDMTAWELFQAAARMALAPHLSIHMRTLQGVNRVDPRDGLWYFYVDASDIARLRGDFR